MAQFEVVVGNIGTVEDRNFYECLKAYGEYVKQSKAGYGRAADERVTLFRDGEIQQEHIPGCLEERGGGMNLEGDLAKIFIEKVRPHVGHDIRVVEYGETSHAAVNLSIECEDCHVVLIDVDIPETVSSLVDQVAEEATGCYQHCVNAQLYLEGGCKVDDSKAAELIRSGEAIHDPNAGAGTYSRFAERMGFERIERFDQTSSAGDWVFVVLEKDREGESAEWHLLHQENRHPGHGFKYLRSARAWYGTYDEVLESIVGVGNAGD